MSKEKKAGYEFKCTNEGLAPVLHNRYVPEIVSKDITLDDKAYKDKKGMYMPVNNIRMMLIGNTKRQGAAKILGSQIEKSKGTAYVNFCKACVFVESFATDPTKVYFQPLRKTWDDVDKRSYINLAGGRNYIERPMIKLPWRLTFKIVVFEETYAKTTIRKFFEVAGMRCGVGDFGPTFGRFRIVDWKELK